MNYRKPTLSEADLDLMWEFQDRAMNSVCVRDFWYNSTIPQGVSVVLKHSRDRIEYMFTKDEKYSGKRDFCEEASKKDALARVIDYTPDDYVGVVLYMNRDALAMVSNHKRNSGCHGFA